MPGLVIRDFQGQLARRPASPTKANGYEEGTWPRSRQDKSPCQPRLQPTTTLDRYRIVKQYMARHDVCLLTPRVIRLQLEEVVPVELFIAHANAKVDRVLGRCR